MHFAAVAQDQAAGAIEAFTSPAHVVRPVGDAHTPADQSMMPIIICQGYGKSSFVASRQGAVKLAGDGGEGFGQIEPPADDLEKRGNFRAKMLGSFCGIEIYIQTE